LNKASVHRYRSGLFGDRHSEIGAFYHGREEWRLDGRMRLAASFDLQLEHADLLDDFGLGFGRSGCKKAR
jgi:hypothetical protein